MEAKFSQANYRLYHFGASTKDHDAIEKARRKWLRNATLPSRVEDSHGFGGMCSTFFVDEQTRAKDSDSESQWWFDGAGEKALDSLQALDTLEESSALDYMLEKRNGDADIIMGPYSSQTQLKLSPGESLSMIDVWQHDSDRGNRSSTSENYKRGFILNLGAKVNCLDWAPNTDGSAQYLAVSTLPQRQTLHRPLQNPVAPAFTPRPSYKANLQIWRFQTSADGTIDVTRRPNLEIVLCTEWGDVKALKWCQMSFAHGAQSEISQVGLLAGVWGDGALRILDISLPRDNDRTRWLYVKRAAFESKPPDTVCTCLTWISSTKIAAGCANGCIAVWDLPKSYQPRSAMPRPTIYTSISPTYILSITTCYPSRPHLLLAGSMAGTVSMTDLSRSGQSLSSHSNTVLGSRARLSLPLLVWHEFAQIAIHADDHSAVKGSTLRRFFANVSLARGRSSATSLASSPNHPCILVGCANGDVFATNPLNRVLESNRSQTWQQIWFAHEWRRPGVENSTGEGGGEGPEMSTNGSVGVSRITEGYKAESVAFAGEDRHGQTHNRHQGTAFTTIYEEKSAITAVAWNPNPHVGGWAAAGMGDGLLKVEDISI